MKKKSVNITSIFLLKALRFIPNFWHAATAAGVTSMSSLRILTNFSVKIGQNSKGL